jgi:hypothetical protein
LIGDMQAYGLAMSARPIVTAMMSEALESAAALAREQAFFATRLRMENMQVIVDDIADWIDEHDHGRLDDAASEMRQLADGRLVFHSPLRDEPFVIRVYSTRELSVGGRIVPVNHDLAVLDQEPYGDLINRLLDWFGVQPAGRKTRRLGG